MNHQALRRPPSRRRGGMPTSNYLGMCFATEELGKSMLSRWTKSICIMTDGTSLPLADGIPSSAGSGREANPTAAAARDIFLWLEAKNSFYGLSAQNNPRLVYGCSRIFHVERRDTCVRSGQKQHQPHYLQLLVEQSGAKLSQYSRLSVTSYT